MGDQDELYDLVNDPWELEELDQTQLPSQQLSFMDTFALPVWITGRSD